jgi:hypothetical protein
VNPVQTEEDKPAVRRRRKRRLWVALAMVGLGLAATIGLLCGGGSILSRCIAGTVERALAKAQPGIAVHIGKADYSLAKNRLACQAVQLNTSNVVLRLDRVAVTGVDWRAMFSAKPAPSNLLAHARFEASNVVLRLPGSEYELRCARLQGSVLRSELALHDAELRPLQSAEEFFAARTVRRTRVRVALPSLEVTGLDYAGLLQGKAWRAQAIVCTEPAFEALVNRDKPQDLAGPPPLMVHEALTAIRQPIAIERFRITHARIRYGERRAVGAAPGWLTFGEVEATAHPIANQASPGTTILLEAQGKLMDAGILKLSMSIPITSNAFSLHYSGSLSEMDLTRLNGFLEQAEYTRIKSGSARAVAFDVEVRDGHATGRLVAVYHGLQVAVLDKKTGTETGVLNRLESFLSNAFRIRNSSRADDPASLKPAEIEYDRGPRDTFFSFVWFAVRSGVFHAIKF